VRADLVTRFEAASPDEEQLNNLTLWLDQTQFDGFEDVDYRFEYSSAGTIGCCVPGDLTPDRLLALAAAIDRTLELIVSDMAPRTESAQA
jgi:hypothetical protein